MPIDNLISVIVYWFLLSTYMRSFTQPNESNELKSETCKVNYL